MLGIPVCFVGKDRGFMDFEGVVPSNPCCICVVDSHTKKTCKSDLSSSGTLTGETVVTCQEGKVSVKSSQVAAKLFLQAMFA